MIKAYNVEIPQKNSARGKSGNSKIIKDINAFLDSGAQNAEIEVEERAGLTKAQVARKMASAYNTALCRIGMQMKCAAIIRGERFFIVYKEDEA